MKFVKKTATSIFSSYFSSLLLALVPVSLFKYYLSYINHFLSNYMGATDFIIFFLFFSWLFTLLTGSRKNLKLQETITQLTTQHTETIAQLNTQHAEAINQLNEQLKRFKSRIYIPHINAAWDEQIIPHCKKCDSLFELKKDPNIQSLTMFHYCPECKVIQHSFDENGMLISAQNAKKIALTHFQSLQS